MYKLRVLMILFYMFLMFTLIFFQYPTIAAITSFLTALIVAIGLFQFLSEMKTLKIDDVRIEEVTFVRNFVFRAYVKIKDVWILFDKKEKRFRTADFRELPVKAVLTVLIGLVFLYVSYLMLSTITQALEFFAFRATVLIVLLVVGIYDFFLGLARIASLGTGNSHRVCRILNKNVALKNFLTNEKASFEITPNFLLWRGFVTSIEFIVPHKIQTKPLEKTIVRIAKTIEKIK